MRRVRTGRVITSNGLVLRDTMERASSSGMRGYGEERRLAAAKQPKASNVNINISVSLPHVRRRLLRSFELTAETGIMGFSDRRCTVSVMVMVAVVAPMPMHGHVCMSIPTHPALHLPMNIPHSLPFASHQFQRMAYHAPSSGLQQRIHILLDGLWTSGERYDQRRTQGRRRRGRRGGIDYPCDRTRKSC